MEYVVLTIGIIALLVACFALLAVWRLNKYIQYRIEDKQEEHEEKMINIIQSLKIIVKEGLIRDNGRIKRSYLGPRE